MTLPASGAISHSEITAEYGAPAATPMSDLYRAGPYVPDSAPNAGIPTSGAIAFSDFYSGNATHRLDTTVTQANGGGSGIGFLQGSFGSMADQTFNDGNHVGRTIVRLTYNAPNFLMDLSGTSIPNNDETFSSIVVNATTFNRSAATYTADTGAGGTRWLWNTGAGGNPWGANPNNFDLFATVP